MAVVWVALHAGLSVTLALAHQAHPWLQRDGDLSWKALGGSEPGSIDVTPQEIFSAVTPMLNFTGIINLKVCTVPCCLHKQPGCPVSMVLVGCVLNTSVCCLVLLSLSDVPGWAGLAVLAGVRPTPFTCPLFCCCLWRRSG